MENEIIETVLKEILDEQKGVAQSNEKMQRSLSDITKIVSQFGSALKNQKISPRIDTQPIEQIVKTEISQLSSFIFQFSMHIQGKLDEFLETSKIRRTRTWIICFAINFFVCLYFIVIRSKA